MVEFIEKNDAGAAKVTDGVGEAFLGIDVQSRARRPDQKPQHLAVRSIARVRGVNRCVGVAHIAVAAGILTLRAVGRRGRGASIQRVRAATAGYGQRHGRADAGEYESAIHAGRWARRVTHERTAGRTAKGASAIVFDVPVAVGTQEKLHVPILARSLHAEGGP